MRKDLYYKCSAGIRISQTLAGFNAEPVDGPCPKNERNYCGDCHSIAGAVIMAACPSLVEMWLPRRRGRKPKTYDPFILTPEYEAWARGNK